MSVSNANKEKIRWRDMKPNEMPCPVEESQEGQVLIIELNEGKFDKKYVFRGNKIFISKGGFSEREIEFLNNGRIIL